MCEEVRSCVTDGARVGCKRGEARPCDEMSCEKGKKQGIKPGRCKGCFEEKCRGGGDVAISSWIEHLVQRVEARCRRQTRRSERLYLFQQSPLPSPSPSHFPSNSRCLCLACFLHSSTWEAQPQPPTVNQLPPGCSPCQAVREGREESGAAHTSTAPREGRARTPGGGRASLAPLRPCTSVEPQRLGLSSRAEREEAGDKIPPLPGGKRRGRRWERGGGVGGSRFGC